MTKTLNQITLFSSTEIRIFFSTTIIPCRSLIAIYEISDYFYYEMCPLADPVHLMVLIFSKFSINEERIWHFQQRILQNIHVFSKISKESTSFYHIHEKYSVSSTFLYNGNSWSISDNMESIDLPTENPLDGSFLNISLEETVHTTRSPVPDSQNILKS
jgi:hypothetical protein